MRVIFGKCSAEYSGRGETVLPEFDRVVVLKGDGSVSIHSDAGFKPINYMAGKCKFSEYRIDDDVLVWEFTLKKDRLVITFSEVYEDRFFGVPEGDPGFSSKDGSESQLQEWLSVHPEVIGDGLEFVQREFQTGAGPVDLLFRRVSDNALFAVEVKREAAVGVVGQVMRYADALEDKYEGTGTNIIPVVAAPVFKDSALRLCDKHNVLVCNVPIDWLAFYRDQFGEEASGEGEDNSPNKILPISDNSSLALNHSSHSANASNSLFDLS